MMKSLDRDNVKRRVKLTSNFGEYLYFRCVRKELWSENGVGYKIEYFSRITRSKTNTTSEWLKRSADKLNKIKGG